MVSKHFLETFCTKLLTGNDLSWLLEAKDRAKDLPNPLCGYTVK